VAKGNAIPAALAGLLLSMFLPPALAQEAKPAWQDDERKFKSDDPNYGIRRSEHFLFLWGKGSGSQ